MELLRQSSFFKIVLSPRKIFLGKEGEGFNIAMQTLDRTRPKDAAISVGISQGALDYTIDYVKKGILHERAPSQVTGGTIFISGYGDRD